MVLGRKRELLKMHVWTDLLLECEDNYTSDIAKKIDCTYSHVVTLINSMIKMGIMSKKLDGRIKKIVLTRKGKDLRDSLDKTKIMIERCELPVYEKN